VGGWMDGWVRAFSKDSLSNGKKCLKQETFKLKANLVQTNSSSLI
jgi:hypothetical protein